MKNLPNFVGQIYIAHDPCFFFNSIIDLQPTHIFKLQKRLFKIVTLSKINFFKKVAYIKIINRIDIQRDLVTFTIELKRN